MTHVGVTGHQAAPDAAWDWIARAVRALLSATPPPLVCISSLASGADQLVARLTLEAGGKVIAVIPSDGYEATFTEATDLSEFRRLLQASSEQHWLPFPKPTEESYLAAGHAVVDLSDFVVAIWDAEPARGLGGTADVVAYAREHHVPVEVVWPPGTAR